ncbi:hypothetical protein ACXPWS_10530 [Mycobacterium sp. BMJ-28]
MKVLLLSIAVVCGLAGAPGAFAETPYGNFELRIQGRYDFHTWIWALSGCGGDCVHVQAIPQPVGRAFPYQGYAQLMDGRYTLVVDIPDGLRCGNVYYGSTIATRDAYSWDAFTHSGTLSSSFAAGCDGSPGGTFTYPFDLTLM